MPITITTASGRTRQLPDTTAPSTSGYSGTDQCLCCGAHISDPHDPACPVPITCAEEGCEADMSTDMCPNDKGSCVDHCGEDHSL